MAYEALAWPDEPALTDAEDPGETYNMGGRFSLVEAGPCPGVRWRVPDTVEPPAIDGHVVAIWTTIGETRLAAKAFTPVPGGYQDILFDEPIMLAAATYYVVSIYTRHYVFRNAAGLFPVTSPSGNIILDEGRLVGWNSGSLIYPASAFNALYYVSPLIGTVDGGSDELLDVGPAGTMPAGEAAVFAGGGRLTAGPAAAMPAPAPAATFTAGGRLTAASASTLPSGSTVALRRGDVLTARPAGTLPGPGRASFAEVDPSAGTSSPNPALLTVTRARVELTTSRPHVLTTGAL
ncbi:DUF4082 domain-containing protein [Actinoplanes sp. NPDC049599]|uniref:DUF4082 domain-containing protein n=1 Tax=Actinoplanes sp. NPDC049599 TaxID=3363903 RepID=UPI00378A5E08